MSLLALFYRALRVPCVGCPAWLDSIKHAWRNKHAMGALRAEHKGRKNVFFLDPARPGPISNKHACEISMRWVPPGPETQ